MKVTINNQQTDNKQLEYEETFWLGKRTIKYDGVEMTKVKFNKYLYKNGEIEEEVQVKGNQVFGVKLKMFGKEIEVVRKLNALEICLALLVFIPCVLFGAIGGAFGGGFGFTNLVLIRMYDKWYIKTIISVLMAGLALSLSYIFACLVFKIVFFFM